MSFCALPLCVMPLCVMPVCVLALCVLPFSAMPFSAWYLYDSGFSSISSSYRGLSFTNFDSEYFRFDLTLFTFRSLNFGIHIPSYTYLDLGCYTLNNIPNPGTWIRQILTRTHLALCSIQTSQHSVCSSQNWLHHEMLVAENTCVSWIKFDLTWFLFKVKV